MESKLLRYYSLEKVTDHAHWLNFSRRVSGDRFGVVPSADKGYFVAPIGHSSFTESEFIDLDSVPDYTEMSFNDIQLIRADEDPLWHWEELNGAFAIMDGELLRYILFAKIPLERLIRWELASRGHDKNHKWCGFDKAREIWLEDLG